MVEYVIQVRAGLGFFFSLFVEIGVSPAPAPAGTEPEARCGDPAPHHADLLVLHVVLLGVHHPRPHPA